MTKLMTFIIGPCAIESRDSALKSASKLKEIQNNINNRLFPNYIEIVYKSCYKKANRTELCSFHGIGLAKGATILREIKERFNMRVTSDVHSLEEIEEIGPVLDIIQIPQSLSRYSEVIMESALVASRYGHMISIKKGVFMGPDEITNAFKKAKAVLPKDQIILIERGNKFGYDNMIVDFLNLKLFKELGAVSCIDASHPARFRDNCYDLAKAGIVMGAEYVFLEAHLQPEKALCDGKTSVLLDDNLENELLKLVYIKETSSITTKELLC